MVQDKDNANKPEADLKEDLAKPKGKFITSVGRRKTSTATVRIYKKGSGIIMVNEKKLEQYFDDNGANVVKQPLKLSGYAKDHNFYIMVKGGGKIGQAEAVRHGICRGLLELEETIRPSLKSKGWLTRDARIKERKKPGLKKARRAPQWSKR